MSACLPCTVRAAFDAATVALHRDLYRQSTALCGEADAPDAVSDTLLAAWLIWKRFHLDSASNVRAWLLSINDRICRRVLRARARRRETLLPLHLVANLAEGPGGSDVDTLLWEIETEQLHTLVSKAVLTEKQTFAIRRALDGDSYAEIALRLHVTKPAVQDLMRRVVARLIQQNRETIEHDILEAYRENERDARRLTYHAPACPFKPWKYNHPYEKPWHEPEEVSFLERCDDYSSEVAAW